MSDPTADGGNPYARPTPSAEPSMDGAASARALGYTSTGSRTRRGQPRTAAWSASTLVVCSHVNGFSTPSAEVRPKWP